MLCQERQFRRWSNKLHLNYARDQENERKLSRTKEQCNKLWDSVILAKHLMSGPGEITESGNSYQYQLGSGPGGNKAASFSDRGVGQENKVFSGTSRLVVRQLLVSLDAGLIWFDSQWWGTYQSTARTEIGVAFIHSSSSASIKNETEVVPLFQHEHNNAGTRRIEDFREWGWYELTWDMKRVRGVVLSLWGGAGFVFRIEVRQRIEKDREQYNGACRCIQRITGRAQTYYCLFRWIILLADLAQLRPAAPLGRVTSWVRYSQMR